MLPQRKCLYFQQLDFVRVNSIAYVFLCKDGKRRRKEIRERERERRVSSSGQIKSKMVKCFVGVSLHGQGDSLQFLKKRERGGGGRGGSKTKFPV